MRAKRKVWDLRRNKAGLLFQGGRSLGERWPPPQGRKGFESCTTNGYLKVYREKSQSPKHQKPAAIRKVVTLPKKQHRRKEQQVQLYMMMDSRIHCK